MKPITIMDEDDRVADALQTQVETNNFLSFIFRCYLNGDDEALKRAVKERIERDRTA